MAPTNHKLIGDSPEFASVLRAARLVAATDATVLILGESGTGKELLAHVVHTSSRRAHKPFEVLNCAAIPESLVESELFGHSRGAFTGAVADYPGRIPSAEGGTLFLDEVGELPASAQAKLLRFLECGECQTMGRVRPRKVDVRVIAATNRDLHAEVRAGRFREDLFYRLHVVPLELPALRQRSGDVSLLLQHLTEERACYHRLPAPRYSDEALHALTRYPWPGNVRELRNLCERMVILFPGKTVHLENLPREMRHANGAWANVRLPAAGLHLQHVEVEMIRQALEKTSGNRSRAARLLGISRDTLLYRLKKYAIQP